MTVDKVRNSGVIMSLLADLGGSSSAVERQLPKLDVAGSIPVSRSKFVFVACSSSDPYITPKLEWGLWWVRLPLPELSADDRTTPADALNRPEGRPEPRSPCPCAPA